jgi:hypothetical protein
MIGRNLNRQIARGALEHEAAQAALPRIRPAETMGGARGSRSRDRGGD